MALAVTWTQGTWAQPFWPQKSTLVAPGLTVGTDFTVGTADMVQMRLHKWLQIRSLYICSLLAANLFTRRGLAYIVVHSMVYTLLYTLVH